MIKVISTLTDLMFFATILVLFYLSIKRCFWKGDRKKPALFFMSLLTHPIVIYVIAMILFSWLSGFTALFAPNYFDSLMAYNDLGVLTIHFTLIGVAFLLLLFASSTIINKWLHAENRSLILFIDLMYSVSFVLTMEDVSRITDGLEVSGELFNVILNSIFIIAMAILYKYIIIPLSRLTGKSKNTDWRVFVIPPTVFIIAFSGVSMPMLSLGSLDGQASLIMFIFAIIIVFMFLWAFYVIIRNISATAEALEAKDEVKSLSVEVMEALAHTIDAKDKYTKGHSIRVAKYSRMLAQKMGFSGEECETIYYMGLLHDLGKIGVDNDIINSPGPLTDEQYGEIKKHPGLGYEILSEIKSRPDLVIGARWHHERYDGKGYPDGKAGEDIPMYARIIAVADSYDAMTSNRSYRNYMAQEKVRSELEKNSGTQFDPKVAECMISIIDEDKNYELHE